MAILLGHTFGETSFPMSATADAVLHRTWLGWDSPESRRPAPIGSWTMRAISMRGSALRSEEHTSELQSHLNLVCRLLLEKKKKNLRLPEYWQKYSAT